MTLLIKNPFTTVRLLKESMEKLKVFSDTMKLYEIIYFAILFIEKERSKFDSFVKKEIGDKNGFISGDKKQKV